MFYDKLTYIYLEMPKFKKEESELENIFDKWLFAMKNLYNLLDRPASLQEAVFKRFFEQAEIANFSQQERRDYRESQKDFWDLFAVTETAEKKGRAEGLAEGEAIGMQKGRAEATIANAHKMIEAGFPVEKVLEILGLTVEDIQRE